MWSTNLKQLKPEHLTSLHHQKDELESQEAVVCDIVGSRRTECWTLPGLSLERSQQYNLSGTESLRHKPCTR